MKRVLYFLVCLFPSVVHAADNKVIASIKPLHSLVAAVMEGTGDTPMLLVEGSASPHTYSLKPSQAAALQKADIIFTISDDFEIFLKKPLASLPKNVTRVPLDKETMLTLYPVRKDSDFAALLEKNGQENKDIHATGRDLHYWLFSDNVKAMVMEIARQLSIKYPDKRQRYFANAKIINSKLELMHTDIDVRIANLGSANFIFFHDGLQYFEKDYRINVAGVVTLHAGEAPGAKRINALREKIKSLDKVCVFREPSFDGKIVETLLQGTKAKSGVLDAEGALLEPGSQLYFQLIEGIAKSLETCLSA